MQIRDSPSQMTGNSRRLASSHRNDEWLAKLAWNVEEENEKQEEPVYFTKSYGRAVSKVMQRLKSIQEKYNVAKCRFPYLHRTYFSQPGPRRLRIDLEERNQDTMPNPDWRLNALDVKLMKLEHLFPRCSVLNYETTSRNDHGLPEEDVSAKTLPRRHNHHSTLSRRFFDGVKNAFERLSTDMQNNDYSVVRHTNETTAEKIFVYKEISSLVGTFRLRMIKLLGFARLSPGDLFEIVFYHGQQHYKAKCRIQGFDKDQLWDREIFFFEYEFGEALNISAFEWNSISKSCLIDNVSIDLLTFLNSSEGLITPTLTRTGSIKVDLGIEWRKQTTGSFFRPLDNCDSGFSFTADPSSIYTKRQEEIKIKPRPPSSIRQHLLNRRLTVDDTMLIFALTDTFKKVSYQLDRYRHCIDSQLGDLGKVIRLLSSTFFKFIPKNESPSHSDSSGEWLFDTSSYDLNICLLQHLRMCSSLLHDIFTSTNGRQYRNFKLNQLDDEIRILNDLFDLRTISSLSDIADSLSKLKVPKDVSNFWLSACGNRTEICTGLFLTCGDIKQELERTFGYFVTANFSTNYQKVFDDIMKEISKKYASREDLLQLNTICTVFEFTSYFKSDSIMAVCERFAKEYVLLEKLSSSSVRDIIHAFDIMNSKFFDPKILTLTVCSGMAKLLSNPNNVIRTSTEAFIDAAKCSSYLSDLTEKFATLCLDADDFQTRLGACRALYCLNAHDRLSTLIKVSDEDVNDTVRAGAAKMVKFLRDQMAESQRKFFAENYGANQ